MKVWISFMFFLSLGVSTLAQEANPFYDPELALKLGADELGMKNYTLVILKTGPAVIEDKALRDSLFAGHFSNMTKMSEAGKLIVAGPLAANEQTYRGLFILNTIDEQEVRDLLKEDPTIASGIFEVELFIWYGSAALPVYLETHKKIQKRGL